MLKKRDEKKQIADPDFTVIEVAERLGCCRETVINKYIKTGRLIAFKAGRGYRVPHSALRSLRVQLQEDQLRKVQKRMAPKFDDGGM